MANDRNPPNPTLENNSERKVLLINLVDQEDLLGRGASFSTRSASDFILGKKLIEILPPLKSATGKSDSDTSKKTIAAIAERIKAHIEQHGTVEELRFGGHGNSKRMFFDDQPLRTDDLLNAIHQIQRETGKKVAEQITFAGCNVFTNLPPEWVKHFRMMSKELGAEIRGTTDYLIKGPVTGFEAASFISFKNGEVNRSTYEMDNPIMGILAVPAKVLIDLQSTVIYGARYSDRWANCHEGKTQEQGEACMKKLEVFEVIDAKTAEWLSAPARFIREKYQELTKPVDDKGKSR